MNNSTPEHPPRDHDAHTRTGGRERGHSAEYAAWLFYAIAAVGSTAGQVWVGVTTPPWPASFPWWVRGLLVVPFAAVIDLGGVVTSAMADWRQRLGETAYSWRALSACTVAVAVAINLIGHSDNPYLAVVFAGLGVFAYTIWLAHSAARRRDALRAAGKLADTAPDYGVIQRLREPAITRRAEMLAVEHGHDLFTSLRLARQQLHDEARNAAVAKHVATLIRAQHRNPVLADIAATTLNIDAVAAQLTARADVAGWARAIGANLLPPPASGNDTTSATLTDGHHDDPAATAQVAASQVLVAPPADVLKRIPTRQVDYDHWRLVWADMQANPTAANSDIAEQHHISLRQAQWIRAVGAARLLDSAIPPVIRLQQLALGNGHHPLTPQPAS